MVGCVAENKVDAISYPENFRSIAQSMESRGSCNDVKSSENKLRTNIIQVRILTHSQLKILTMTKDDLLLIRDFTSTDEKREISGDFGYQKDTVSAVIRGDRRVTDDNKPMFDKLLEKAKENQEQKQLQK